MNFSCFHDDVGIGCLDSLAEMRHDEYKDNISDLTAYPKQFWSYQNKQENYNYNTCSLFKDFPYASQMLIKVPSGFLYISRLH